MNISGGLNSEPRNLSAKTMGDMISSSILGDSLTHAVMSYGVRDVNGDVMVRAINIRGQNPNVSNAAINQVVGPGGGVHIWPLDAQPLTLTQNGTGDDYDLELTVLDADYNEFKEIVTISDTPVTTVGNVLRLNELNVVRYGVKQNDLTVSHPTGSDYLMQANCANFQYNLYTAPAGYFMIISSQVGGVGKNTDADAIFNTQVNINGNLIPSVSNSLPVYENTFIVDFKNWLNPTLVPPKGEFRLDSRSSINNSRITTSASAILIREDIVGILNTDLRQLLEEILKLSGV